MNHGKRDANQAEIVEALRKAGASVLDLADVGHGCPDLPVGYAGHNWLMEVKSPKGTMTDDEISFVYTWHGQFHQVFNIDEALAVIGIRSK